MIARMEPHKIAIPLGVALVVVGVLGWVLTGFESVTALIPAVLGVAIAVVGRMAQDPSRRKMAMHIAAGLGLIGLLGTLSGLFKLPSLLTGGDVERPGAVASQSITALLCLGFVAVCVRSFMAARTSSTRA